MYRLPSEGFRVQDFRLKHFDHKDGTHADKSDLSPECNAKHSEEPDPLRGAQARLGTYEVRRAAGSPMGAEEGAAGPGIVTIGAAKHLRRHDPGSPTALDHRPVARHIPIFERGIRVIQPDGGPP